MPRFRSQIYHRSTARCHYFGIILDSDPIQNCFERENVFKEMYPASMRYLLDFTLKW